MPRESGTNYNYNPGGSIRPSGRDYETDPLLNVRYCAGHQTFHLKDCFTRSQVVSAPAARACSKWFASGRPFPVGVCQISTPAKMAFAYNQNLEVNGLEPLTSHADLADLSTPLPRDAVQDLIARIYSDERWNQPKITHHPTEAGRVRTEQVLL